MSASTSAPISAANVAWSFFPRGALLCQALAHPDVLLRELLEPPAILRLGPVLRHRLRGDALAIRPALLCAAVKVVRAVRDDRAVPAALGEGLLVDAAAAQARDGPHLAEDVEALGLVVGWTHRSLLVGYCS